jgi:C1A family cysteine protease
MKTSTIILLTLSCLVVSTAALTWSEENSHEYTFDDYMVEFNRKYETQNEYFMRRTIFENHLKQINEINSRANGTWKAGVNEFTDKLESERESLRGFKRVSELLSKSSRNLKVASYSEKNYPSSLDWRTKGVVNEVKNQKACGSCWAFAAVAVLESRDAIKNGKLQSFSEQQLVDCAPNVHKCGGTGGCEGSDQPLAFDYVRAAGGIALESEYEYHARDEKCKDKEVNKYNAEVVGFNLVTPNSVDALMEAIQDGPVTISVDATNFHLYSKGIFHSTDCGAEINHAVVLVGYGEENGQKYWIVRNSWSNTWGENGYIRLARESSQKEVRCFVDLNPASGSACENGPTQVYVCGTCGMYSSTSFPVLG